MQSTSPTQVVGQLVSVPSHRYGVHEGEPALPSADAAQVALAVQLPVMQFVPAPVVQSFFGSVLTVALIQVVPAVSTTRQVVQVSAAVEQRMSL